MASKKTYYDISGQAFSRSTSRVTVSTPKSSIVLNRVYPGIGFIPLSCQGGVDLKKPASEANNRELESVRVSGLDMTKMGDSGVETPIATFEYNKIVGVLMKALEDDEYYNDVQETRRVIDKLRNNAKCNFPVFDLAEIDGARNGVKVNEVLLDKYLTFFGDPDKDPVYGVQVDDKQQVTGWVTIDNAQDAFKGFAYIIHRLNQLYMHMLYMDYINYNMDPSFIEIIIDKGGIVNKNVGWIDLIPNTKFGLDSSNIKSIVDEFYSKSNEKSFVEITREDVMLWVRFKYLWKNSVFHKLNPLIDALHIDTKTYDISVEKKDTDTPWFLSENMWVTIKSATNIMRDGSGQPILTELLSECMSWYTQLKMFVYDDAKKL